MHANCWCDTAKKQGMPPLLLLTAGVVQEKAIQIPCIQVLFLRENFGRTRRASLRSTGPANCERVRGAGAAAHTLKTYGEPQKVTLSYSYSKSFWYNTYCIQEKVETGQTHVLSVSSYLILLRLKGERGGRYIQRNPFHLVEFPWPVFIKNARSV